MKTLFDHSIKPNWLLGGLICISVIIHFVLLIYICRFYRSRNLAYIELTIEDVTKPRVPDIPRPRKRIKSVSQIKDIDRIRSAPKDIPQLNSMKIEPVAACLPESLIDGIQIPMPEISGVSNLDITEWSPVSLIEDIDDSAAKEGYLDLVRLKIEKNKEYPAIAKKKRIEGSVTVQFVIDTEGNLRQANILKGSGHEILNTAALRAVKNAAPFPNPPKQSFKGDISLELTIVFEIT